MNKLNKISDLNFVFITEFKLELWYLIAVIIFELTWIWNTRISFVPDNFFCSRKRLRRRRLWRRRPRWFRRRWFRRRLRRRFRRRLRRLKTVTDLYFNRKQKEEKISFTEQKIARLRWKSEATSWATLDSKLWILAAPVKRSIFLTSSFIHSKMHINSIPIKEFFFQQKNSFFPILYCNYHAGWSPFNFQAINYQLELSQSSLSSIELYC